MALLAWRQHKARGGGPYRRLWVEPKRRRPTTASVWSVRAAVVSAAVRAPAQCMARSVSHDLLCCPGVQERGIGVEFLPVLSVARVPAVSLAAPRGGGELKVATVSPPQQPWAWGCQHRRARHAQRRSFQRAIVCAQAIPQQPATMALRQKITRRVHLNFETESAITDFRNPGIISGTHALIAPELCQLIILHTCWVPWPASSSTTLPCTSTTTPTGNPLCNLRRCI